MTVSRRRLLGVGSLALVTFALDARGARGQAASAGPADRRLIEDLVAANRILVARVSSTATDT